MRNSNIQRANERKKRGTVKREAKYPPKIFIFNQKKNRERCHQVARKASGKLFDIQNKIA